MNTMKRLLALCVSLWLVVSVQAQDLSSPSIQFICEDVVNGFPPGFDLTYFIVDSSNTSSDTLYRIDTDGVEQVQPPAELYNPLMLLDMFLSPSGEMFMVPMFYPNAGLAVWRPETNETAEYHFSEPYSAFNFPTPFSAHEYYSRRVLWLDDSTIQINIFDRFFGRQLLRTVELRVSRDPLSLTLARDVTYVYPDPLPYPEYETDVFRPSASASYSPSGRYLTLIDYATNPGEGYFRLLDGETLNVLLDIRPDEQRQYSPAIWSDDEASAAVFSEGGFRSPGVASEIMLLRLDGEQTSSIIFNSAALAGRDSTYFSSLFAQWSEDAQYLAFELEIGRLLSAEGTQKYIAVLDRERQHIRASCLPADFEYGSNLIARWSPDNRFVGLFSRSGFYVLARDTGVIYQLPDTLDVFPRNLIYFAGWIPNEAADEE